MNDTLPIGAQETLHRAIVFQTRGTSHGPITRLVSPSDLGQRLKPFIFLDLFDAAAGSFKGFGKHPHSGIATLTWLIQGSTDYEDSTGKAGVLAERGVEWMQAGGGVWHSGAPHQQQRTRGFQLWVALPPELENAAPLSQYIAPGLIERDGPALVLLGRLGAASSVITPPSPMNYLSVTLAAGERWSYQPPSGHDVAWMAVNSGSVFAPSRLDVGELAVFEPSQNPIALRADVDCEFVLGSAASHPHDLAIGNYSVHTNPQALREGEAQIARIGARLRAEGRLR